MRRILFDTESTGLDSKTHRLVSIAGVELMDDVPTGDFFHFYLNPERPCDPGAFAVHGLSDEFLAVQPKFADVWPKIKKFLGSSPLIAHNARFDMAFLDAEVMRLRPVEALPANSAVCTVERARKYRGWGGKGHNTLDTLAAVYGIPNYRHLTGKHGALIDCLVLYGVYRALFGMEPRPLLPSEVEHFTDQIPDLYYAHTGQFAALRTGRPFVSAGSGAVDVAADVCPGSGGAGQDLRADAEVTDAAGSGESESILAADGNHQGSGGARSVDPLLAAVRRGGV